MSIALISSLYRCERHLPTFSAAVFGFAKRVSESGISVHYLPIVNDPSRREREQIDRLAAEINGHYYGRMTPHFVPRETLYASWNRGITLAQTTSFSFWNADDFRSADAFIAGYHALQDGNDLVDFPYTRVQRVKQFRIFKRDRHSGIPCAFARERFDRKGGLGPFFMANKSLYAKVGPFDQHFRIAGDTDWASRAQPKATFQQVNTPGGEFHVHGDNLSNSGADREDIEVNIIFMRRADWHLLRPANPNALREAWDSWGNPAGITIPGDVEEYIWGAGAETRWKQYQGERRQHSTLRRLRLALAARGLINSIEWDVAQRDRAWRQDRR